MNKQEWDNSLLEHFAPKKGGFSLDLLMEMVEEVMDSGVTLLSEEKKQGKRFSQKVDIDILSPSEAWGDPSSQSRQHINKVFRSITGGRDISKRIESINSFLDPDKAIRKRAVGGMINMMMVVESLQATLNDYNESAAGFVFEGFMAALTGGHQVAGKVAGTLPIEDFMAFSEYGGASVPVSLKLLGAGGAVKGSFTNIVDFLLVRGSDKIKYLLAYKLTKSNNVEKLTIHEFDITLTNFIEFIANTSGGDTLLATKVGEKISYDQLREGFNEFAQSGQDALFKGDGTGLAELVVRLGGYQPAGLLHNYVATKARGEEPLPGEPGGRELTPQELAAKEEEARIKADAAAEKRYARASTIQTKTNYGDLTDPERRAAKQAADDEAKAKKDARDKKKAAKAANQPTLQEALARGSVTPAQAFHYIEKEAMLKDSMLNEGQGSDKSQWNATWKQLENLRDTISLQTLGELDLSQSKIDAIANIYTEKINDKIGTLLTAVKDMAEHVSEYYTEKKRTKAAAAGVEAQKDTEVIKQELADDPLGREEK